MQDERLTVFRFIPCSSAITLITSCRRHIRSTSILIKYRLDRSSLFSPLCRRTKIVAIITPRRAGARGGIAITPTAPAVARLAALRLAEAAQTDPTPAAATVVPTLAWALCAVASIEFLAYLSRVAARLAGVAGVAGVAILNRCFVKMPQSPSSSRAPSRCRAPTPSWRHLGGCASSSAAPPKQSHRRSH